MLKASKEDSSECFNPAKRQTDMDRQRDLIFSHPVTITGQ